MKKNYPFVSGNQSFSNHNEYLDRDTAAAAKQVNQSMIEKSGKQLDMYTTTTKKFSVNNVRQNIQANNNIVLPFQMNNNTGGRVSSNLHTKKNTLSLIHGRDTQSNSTAADTAKTSGQHI